MAQESKIRFLLTSKGCLVQNKFWTPESKIYLGRLVQNEFWTPESKIYLGRLVQNEFWTPESKIYLGRLVQNEFVYNDERGAWEREQGLARLPVVNKSTLSVSPTL
jgi:hypothetical protein